MRFEATTGTRSSFTPRLVGHVRGQRGFDPYDLAGRRTESERGIVRFHTDDQRAALLDRGEVVSVRLPSLEGTQTGGEKNTCQQAREMIADSHAVLLARLAWANGTDAASQYSARSARNANLAAAIGRGGGYRLRGSRIVNSLYSPTSLSTVIVPPCCFVTMS